MHNEFPFIAAVEDDRHGDRDVAKPNAVDAEPHACHACERHAHVEREQRQPLEPRLGGVGGSAVKKKVGRQYRRLAHVV